MGVVWLKTWAILYPYFLITFRFFTQRANVTVTAINYPSKNVTKTRIRAANPQTGKLEKILWSCKSYNNVHVDLLRF